MTSNAIMTREQMAIEDVKTLANIVLSLRDGVFKSGLDYGIIPGTGNKPTLLLPGMEKLLRALHLRPEYVEKSRIEDFDKNLIYYRYECRLIDYDTGLCLSTAIGSANSHESKWRWREQKRKCPVCGKEAIIKGKEDYGGGWLCFKKQEGCGAKFKDGDAAIESQVVGRIENPDIFDQMNTIDKIAQKRALASAIKGAANVSEFYTVDLEDFQQYDTSRPAPPENVVEGRFEEVTTDNPSAPVSGAGVRKQEPAPDFPLTEGDTPPNVYVCDALVVNVTKSARQYILKVARSTTRITLTNYPMLDELHMGETPVVALQHGEYPIDWLVTADKTANGWDVQNVETALVAE